VALPACQEARPRGSPMMGVSFRDDTNDSATCRIRLGGQNCNRSKEAACGLLPG
jgi:hypothetical protein